ncbi:MAG: hypothetical protein SVR94_15930 [Pseudomonadota bacterium]|nr:hypothetical protein [Pseudomonadota bacterium]
MIYKIASNFYEEILNFIRNTEIGKDKNAYYEVIDDGIGVPTIGYGYAMLVRNPLDGSFELKRDLTDDFQAIGYNTTSADVTLLQSIADQLNLGTDSGDAIAKELIENNKK